MMQPPVHRTNQPGLVFYNPLTACMLLALHRGPEFPARLRLLRAIEHALGPKRFVVSGRFGERYAVASDDLVQRNLLIYGAYDPEVVERYLDVLSAGDTLLDIGANVGAASLGVAVRTGCRVVAIEADPLTAEVLRHNARRSGLEGRVAVESQALGGRPGRRRFTRAEAGNIGRSGFDVVDPGAEVIDVDVTTLDALAASRGWPRARVWKIDVEGAELEVLEGARELLMTQPPDVIVFEDEATDVATSPVASFLHGVGFECQRIVRPSGDVSTRENFVAERTGA